MPTAVVVDSQMAKCNRFGYQQAIPHSPFIASTSKVLDLQAGKKSFSSGLVKPSQASTTLSRQIHQWLGSRKTGHPYYKRHTGQGTIALRSTFQRLLGLLKYMKVLLSSISRSFFDFSDFPLKIWKVLDLLMSSKLYTKLTFSDFPLKSMSELDLIMSSMAWLFSDLPPM